MTPPIYWVKYRKSNLNFGPIIKGQVRLDTVMPAILLECGIIVNRQEEQKLAELKYQKNLFQV